jgi:hypothetical protein
MRSKLLTLILALGVSVGAASCARSHSNAATPRNAPTTLRVENQGFLDMNVYVVAQGGARNRLGTATGNATSHFTIPSSLIFGPTQLRFVADPIGGQRTSVSESILVSAGDEITLTIPPS